MAANRATDISRIVVDDEHHYWPFNGEYWRDELGYYRVRLLNECEKSAPEGAPSSPDAGVVCTRASTRCRHPRSSMK